MQLLLGLGIEVRWVDGPSSLASAFVGRKCFHLSGLTERLKIIYTLLDLTRHTHRLGIALLRELGKGDTAATE